MAQRFDVSLKTLFRYSHGVVSRMLFGGRVKEWLNVEQPKVRNVRVDMLARLADGSIRHVDLQTGNDSKMPQRMAEYYMGFWRLLGKHVEQVVLYAGRERLTMKSEFRTPCMRHKYRIFNLRKMDGEELLASRDWGDNALALLTKADRERVFQVVARRLRKLKGDEQADAARTFVLLSGILGIEEEVGRRLREDDMIDMMQNKILGPALRVGLAQGRQEALAETVAAQARRRFGRLPARVRAQIRAADEATLRKWSLAVLDAPTLQDMLR